MGKPFKAGPSDNQSLSSIHNAKKKKKIHEDVPDEAVNVMGIVLQAKPVTSMNSLMHTKASLTCILASSVPTVPCTYIYSQTQHFTIIT